MTLAVSVNDGFTSSCLIKEGVLQTVLCLVTVITTDTEQTCMYNNIDLEAHKTTISSTHVPSNSWCLLRQFHLIWLKTFPNLHITMSQREFLLGPRVVFIRDCKK